MQSGERERAGSSKQGDENNINNYNEHSSDEELQKAVVDGRNGCAVRRSETGRTRIATSGLGKDVR
jgi:hypothetical protein